MELGRSALVRVSAAIASLGVLDSRHGSALPGGERARLAGICNPVVRRRSRAAMLLLAELLDREFGDGSPGATLHHAEDGRPVCDQAFVSISHSGDWVACAVARHRPIGIDVQVSDSRYDRAGIARAFFPGDEAAWLGSEPPQAFWRAWALKEAHLKATGDAFPAGLRSMSLKITGSDIRAVSHGQWRSTLRLFERGSLYLGLAVTGAEQVEMAGLELAGDSDWRPWRLAEVATGVTALPHRRGAGALPADRLFE